MIEIVIIFATFMSTSAFMYSSGAYGALERFRNREAVLDFGLFECFLCLSFWFSLIFTFLFGAAWWFFFIAWGVSYIADKLLTMLGIIMVK